MRDDQMMFGIDRDLHIVISPEPDCPRQSSLQGTPETTSPASDRPPQRSGSSDPPPRQNHCAEKSHEEVRFHTARVIFGSRWTSEGGLPFPGKRKSKLAGG